MLATASDSDGEAKTTALGPVSAVEQVDETVLAREGEENDLKPLIHCPEGTILPQTTDIDSTTHFSTVRVELSFEDKEEDDTIAKFIAETCGCTLGPKKSPCSSLLSRDTVTVTCNTSLAPNQLHQSLTMSLIPVQLQLLSHLPEILVPSSVCVLYAKEVG